MTKDKALKLALEALENVHIDFVCQSTHHKKKDQHGGFDACPNVIKHTEAITAIKEALAQPAQEPVEWMDEDERKAFERFNETSEDGEGYDVPKQMMKRLAQIGVVHHTSGGIYGVTEFGNWMLNNTAPPAAQPEHQAEPLTKERILVLVDAYVEASAKCDHILGHYAQTEFQIAQAKADLAKARATFETAIVAAQPEQEPDRQALQAAGTHPAPCARHCEAKAYEIEIRSLKAALRKELEQPKQEPVAWIAEVELSVFARTPKEKTTVEIWKKPVLDSDVAIYTAPPQRPTFYQPAANEAVEILKSLGYVYEPTYTGLAWAKKSAQPEQEQALKKLADLGQEIEQEPTCPKCKAAVLYECVACSSNNYPPKPEQEPVAFAAEIVEDVNGVLSTQWADWWIPNEGDKLYTTLPAAQRSWQGLDEDDIRKLYGKDLNYRDGNYVRYAMAVEAKLKEKNT